jgi:prevent-host-death family protein
MVRNHPPPRRWRKPRGLAEPKAKPFKNAPATWQLQHAKNRFSELVDAALRRGPQEVTRHGKPAVVVVSKVEFDRLTGAGSKPELDFKEFLLSFPKIDGFDEIMEEVIRENRQVPDSSFDPDRDLG